MFTANIKSVEAGWCSERFYNYDQEWGTEDCFYGGPKDYAECMNTWWLSHGQCYECDGDPLYTWRDDEETYNYSYVTNENELTIANAFGQHQFKELYYAYSDYVDFVILCKGSYNTYTEDLSKKSSTLMGSYREIKVELLGE